MKRRTMSIVLTAVAVVAAAIGGTTLANGAGSSQTTQAPAATPAAPSTGQTGTEAAGTETQDANDPADANDKNDPADGNDANGKAEAPDNESGSEAPDSDGPGGHADEPANPNATTQAQGAQ
jgi:hypothetical protein